MNVDVSDHLSGIDLSFDPTPPLALYTLSSATSSRSSVVYFREIADISDDGLVLVDHDLSIIEVNLSFAKLIRTDARDLGGRALFSVLSETSRSAMVDPVPTRAGPSRPFRIDLVPAHGGEVSVEASWSSIELGDGRRGLLKVCVPKADTETSDPVQQDPQHDPLTGLFTRSTLDATIKVEISRANRHGSDFAVLCLDLDGFKAINDTYGHPVGDEALRIVASRIRDTIRDTDIAFRVGGDEFLIVQTHADQAGQSARLAERLIDALGKPFAVDDFPLTLGVSIGIAHFTGDGGGADELLKRADAALYRAKREGKNTHRFFDPSMNDALQTRRRIESELRRAIDHGELSLAYQPQVDLATGKTTAFEALLRCTNPRLGGVSPAAFINVAEEAGLMVAVGEWVISQAFGEAATWPNALGLSINLSTLQIQSGSLVATVRDTLASCGLDPARIVFEVAESTLMLNRDQTLDVLVKLKALGVRIAVDDFGTGHSSLSYLHSFPFDMLKIDRSFVASVDSDPRSAAIVKSLVSLSREIGLIVIAEGVETESQRKVLDLQRCDRIQGFLVGRPQLIETYRQFTGAQATPPPVQAKPVTLAVRDLLSAVPAGTMSVLLADDSQIMGEMTAVIIRTLGFARVDVVRDGETALSRLVSERYDLVISDWNMTPVTGMELLAAMRESPSLREIPFVMLTANGRTTNRIAAKEAGADAFLVKPFRPDILAARIVEAVDNRRNGPIETAA